MSHVMGVAPAILAPVSPAASRPAGVGLYPSHFSAAATLTAPTLLLPPPLAIHRRPILRKTPKTSSHRRIRVQCHWPVWRYAGRAHIGLAGLKAVTHLASCRNRRERPSPASDRLAIQTPGEMKVGKEPVVVAKGMPERSTSGR